MSKYTQSFDPEVNAWIREAIWTHCANVHPPEMKTDEIVFRCPFCGDSKQSKRKMRGHFYLKTGSFYCWNGGCNRAASWQQLLSKILSVPLDSIDEAMLSRRLSNGGLQESGAYLENLEKACKKSGEFVAKAMGIDPVPIVCKLPYGIVSWKDNTISRDHIEARLADLGEFAPDNLDYYWWPSAQRIVIPWLDRAGNTIYWQARTTQKDVEPKYIFPKEGREPLFFMKQDDSWPYCVIVEGVFDGIWVKNGIVCGSCKCSELQKKMVDILRCQGKKIIWMFDNPFSDESSAKSIKKMVKDIVYSQDLFFQWPDSFRDYKDINETVIALGNNPFSSKSFILDNCKSVPEMMI